MAINDDIDDDLPPENPEAVTATLVAAPPGGEQAKPTETDIFGPAAIEGQIPNVQVELVSTVDVLNKATDLEDIKQGIVTDNGVSKEDAIAIESMAPGLITPRVPLSMYSLTRSQSNMKRAIEQIDTGIAGCLASASTSASQLSDTISVAAATHIKLFEERFVGIFTENTEALTSIMTELSTFSLLELNYKKARSDASSMEGLNGYSIHNVLSSDFDRLFETVDEKEVSIFKTGPANEAMRLIRTILVSDSPDESECLKARIKMGNPKYLALKLGYGNDYACVRDNKIVFFNTNNPDFPDCEDVMKAYGIIRRAYSDISLSGVVGFLTGARGLKYVNDLKTLLGTAGLASSKCKEDIDAIMATGDASEEASKTMALLQITGTLKSLYRTAIAASRELEVVLLIVNATTEVLKQLATEARKHTAPAVTQVA